MSPWYGGSCLSHFLASPLTIGMEGQSVSLLKNLLWRVKIGKTARVQSSWMCASRSYGVLTTISALVRPRALELAALLRMSSCSLAEVSFVSSAC